MAATRQPKVLTSCLVALGLVSKLCALEARIPAMIQVVEQRNISAPPRTGGWLRLSRISAYTASADETDPTPSIAACGRIRPGGIAVSRDLFNRGRNCGKRITVRTDRGTYFSGFIWDTMNARYRRTADLLVGTRVGAFRFGVTKGHIRFE